MSLSNNKDSTAKLSLRLSPDRKYPPYKTSLCPPLCCKCCCNVCVCCCCHCCSCCCCCDPCLNFDYSSSSPLEKKNEEKEDNLKYSKNLEEENKYQMKQPLKEEEPKLNIKKYVPYEQKQFNDFLKKLKEIESKIEDAKISLAINPDFNCEDAFRIFESNDKGFLTKDDLKEGLNLIGIYPTGKKLKLLMKRFDLDKKGYINYADFFDMVVPFEKNYRQRVECRPPRSCCPCKCPDVFSNQTIYYLNNLFNLILDFENEINDDRKLLSTVRLRLHNLFGLFDKDRKGYFNYDEMIEYFADNCMLESNREADLLFIRLDKNRNGKIDYYEIEDELQTIY